MITINHNHMPSQRTSGFTLIELMIVIVILGVIAAIAIPAYTNQIIQARRADATSTLLSAAQQLERCFTRFNSYAHASCGNLWDSPDGFYRVTRTTPPPTTGQPTPDPATSFLLTAAPHPDNPTQSRDGVCATITLSHQGVRGSTPNNDPRCWGSR